MWNRKLLGEAETKTEDVPHAKEMPQPQHYRQGTGDGSPGTGEGAHIPLYTQRQVEPVDQSEPGTSSGSVSLGRHQLQAGNQALHLPGKCSLLQVNSSQGATQRPLIPLQQACETTLPFCLPHHSEA